MGDRGYDSHGAPPKCHQPPCWHCSFRPQCFLTVILLEMRHPCFTKEVLGPGSQCSSLGQGEPQ